MGANQVALGAEGLRDLAEAVHSRQPVSGLTHNFYRYPARFSPMFARAAILAFSEPGELVMDPFMGGGTTIVEARALSRRAIGIDISELSFFISSVKSTLMSNNQLKSIRDWADSIKDGLNLREHRAYDSDGSEEAYQRNITGRNTWAIRRVLQIIIARIDDLESSQERQFVRCALLKTAQWALDCRKEIPSVEQFRKHYFADIDAMCDDASLFSAIARRADGQYSNSGSFRTLCLRRSVIGVEREPQVAEAVPPKLILTSPPYPGVHVLYHRWQVQGRRETPAPFWIANAADGNGAAFYTMGDRKQSRLDGYFAEIQRAFSSLAEISDRHTLLVQLVAFPEPSWQLPRYLGAMSKAGFSERTVATSPASGDGRLWRRVPNRKWYAQQRGATGSSKEVILFHKLT